MLPTIMLLTLGKNNENFLVPSRNPFLTRQNEINPAIEIALPIHRDPMVKNTLASPN